MQKKKKERLQKKSKKKTKNSNKVTKNVTPRDNSKAASEEDIKDYKKARESFVKKITANFKRAEKTYRTATGVKLKNNDNKQILLLANLNDAMCLCGDSLDLFKSLGCNKITVEQNKKKGIVKRKKKRIVNMLEKKVVSKCAKIFRRLDGKKPQCVCPINVNSGATCGIPLNFDLYGKGKTNGMVVETTTKKVGNGGLCRQEINVKGLDSKKLDSLKAWVYRTVRMRAKREGSYIRWEDVIPKHVADFILDNCANLKWSVEKKITCRGEEVSGKVEFHGLTYQDVVVGGSGGKRRRRKLLRNSKGSFC